MDLNSLFQWLGFITRLGGMIKKIIVDMNSLSRRLGYIVYLGGTTLVSLLGLLGPFGLSSEWAIPVGLVLWNAAYIASGLVIISEKEALVIERFGQYQRVAMKGIRILCFRGLIDKEKERVDLQWRPVPLWRTDNGKLAPKAELDFEGGVSAPVEAEVWYRIIPTPEAIYKWVYEVGDGEEYIEQVIDSALRPALQQLTLEEANKRKTNVAKDLLNGSDKDILENPMKAIGVELHPQKGILVIDIDIPEAIQKARAQQTEGEYAARKVKAQASGYTGALKAIIDDAKEHGQEMTWKEAEELYFKNRALEAFQGAGSNVTIIGNDVMGMAQTLLGKFNQSPKAPSPDDDIGQTPMTPRRRK